MRDTQKKVAVTVLAGTCAGTGSTLVVHPMDTIRTRLQTAPRGMFTGAADCIRATIKAEGARGLYKGMSAPLAAQGVYKAVLFSAYDFAQSQLATQEAGAPGGRAKLSIPQLALCGGFAGGINSFVVTPIELLRNRLMVQYGRGSSESPLDIMRGVVRTNGVLGMWKGQVPTLFRDVPGVAAFYATYALVMRGFTQTQILDPTSAGAMLSAGGCAGVSFWVVALPMDTVKSRLQTDMEGRYTGARDCVRQIIAEDGLAGLYRGYSMAMTRGVPGAACTFLIFGQASKFWDQLLPGELP